MDVNERILDAIELLANNSVQKAGYDKTIQAQILSCEDQVVGKYRCKYQDAVFYAYTNNPDIRLSKGTLVYILIPGNDMRQQKTIIGMVDKLGADYISAAVGDQAYNIIGTNCVISNNIYYLDSNNIDYSYDLYNVNNASNNIDLDIQGLNQYLKQSSSLIVGAKIRTEIPIQRQGYGHYGIVFNLEFIDENNPNGDPILRSYIINEDNMIDNPYNLLYDTRQYAIYNIDGANFKRVQSITIFNNGFPKANGTTTTGLLNTGDIILSAFEIKGAVRMTEDELNGISISFITPQGTFFMPNEPQDNSKDITAQVRVKSKVVSSSQNIEFYWGVEDVSILSNSDKYNKNLGRGWKCINSFNIISQATAQDPAIIKWTPMGDAYTIKKAEATAYNNRIKVAAVYDGNVVTKQINIQNLSIDADFITITSSLGEKFFYGVGATTLTCNVKGASGNLHYSWAWENNGGLLQPIIGPSNDFIETVSENTLINLQVRKIYNFATFKCSVYEGNIYLGTGSIILTNSMQGEGINPLVINNGSVLYKYSTTGVSPASKSLDKPQQIQALTFVLYDDAGNPKITSDNFIDQGLIQFPATVRWKIPKNNTLLKSVIQPSQAQEQSQSEYYQFENEATFSYEIADRYDINKTNNQIILQISYNGAITRAETNFTFTKEGNIGTNGTEYYVKVMPNTTMKNPPELPMVTKLGTITYELNYGLNSSSSTTLLYNPTEPQQLLKVQIWRSDQLIYETNGSNNLINPTIQWSVLRNHYGIDGANSVDDDTDFTITDAAIGKMIYTDSLMNNNALSHANIIKCAVTIENKIYYGAIPFVTAYVTDSTYRLELKRRTGFYSVMYAPDGSSPEFDNVHPFEFIILQNGKQVQENISYGSEKKGDIKIKTSAWDKSPSNDLSLKDSNENKFSYLPISKYLGECVNNSIQCKYYLYTTFIGIINIPIYFFLNRYGFAHLNEWDGNSIQINEEQGYILAPQMGAGKKQSDNSFSGVLLGEIKNPSQNSSKRGLFGYKSGNQTFYLNSDTGTTILGGLNKTGTLNKKGQIIIDPAANNAMIYSGNFWSNYNSDGLPSSYGTSNEAGAGMLIDLTSPRISFGNGNFKVDSSGNVSLTGDLKAGKIIDGSNIYYNFIVDNSAKANRTPPERLLQAGWNGSDYNFIITADGNVSMAGNITANSGRIGGTNGWTIGYNNDTSQGDIVRGYIYSGTKDSLDKAASGLYIGTDGISAYKSGTGTTFKVDSQGNVTVNGNITLGPGSSISWSALPNDVVAQGDLANVAFSGDYNDLDNQPNIPVLPSYIKSSYISQTLIQSPLMAAGRFYATGQGRNRGAAYYFYDGYTQTYDSQGNPIYDASGDPIGLGTQLGYISFDSQGRGSSGSNWTESSNRILFTSLSFTDNYNHIQQTAIKFRASGNMSLETGWDINSQYVNDSKIYLMNGVQFDNIIKLTRLRATYTSFGYCHYVGTYGSTLPPNRGEQIGTDGQELIDLEIGQLFFKLE